MALTLGVKEVLWLQGLLGDLGAQRHQGEIKQIQCDNQGAIALAKNPEYHPWTNNIDILYYFFRQHVEIGVIQLLYCPTHAVTTDIFTKPLPAPQFRKHVIGLGMGESPTDTAKVNNWRKRQVGE